MPKVYTVQTDNAFSALYDASDNEEVILSSIPPHLQEQPDATQAPRPRREIREDRGPNEKRGPRPPRRDDGVRREEGERRPRPQQGGDEEGQVEGRSHIRNRERRVGPRPEGQSDRQSGTGRGKEVKKEGGGAHGWGNQAEDHGADAWATEPLPAAEGAEGAVEETPAFVKEVAAPAVQSYAEYQKQQNQEAAALSEKAVTKSQRAVEEGCQLYTKAFVQETKVGSKDVKEASKTGKAQATELAAQSGIQVRYSGEDKRRNNRDRYAPHAEDTPAEEAPAKKTPVKEIKLDDNSAFPSLAH